MTRQVLWERREDRTRFGFYSEDEFVKFEYLGPFDLNTDDDWIDARGTFARTDFTETLKALESTNYAELKGAATEKLRLQTSPAGTIVLDFDGGSSNNIFNLDLGILPHDLWAKSQR